MSHRDSCEWIKSKEGKENNGYRKHPGSITKIRPLTNQREWKKIIFPKDWEELKTNCETIALNISFTPANSEEIKQVFILKHNSEHENKTLIFNDHRRWAIAFFCCEKFIWIIIRKSIKV